MKVKDNSAKRQKVRKDAIVAVDVGKEEFKNRVVRNVLAKNWNTIDFEFEERGTRKSINNKKLMLEVKDTSAICSIGVKTFSGMAQALMASWESS